MAETEKIEDRPLEEQVAQLRKIVAGIVLFAFGLYCGFAIGKDS